MEQTIEAFEVASGVEVVEGLFQDTLPSLPTSNLAALCIHVHTLALPLAVSFFALTLNDDEGSKALWTPSFRSMRD